MRSAIVGFVVVLWLVAANEAVGQDADLQRPGEHHDRDFPPEPTPEMPATSICQMIRSAAAANNLPFAFFARVIWRESRFRPDARGPLTRSGEHAQGIAQFMPGTAAEQHLPDPFDPVQALPKSAAFLRRLAAEFGNLGLAAAAYNAGPQRLRDWLAGRRRLPRETLDYVRAVTGRAAEEWKSVGPGLASLRDGEDVDCEEMAKRRPPAMAILPLAARPVAEPPPAATRGWSVQLVGDRSELKALAAYAGLKARYQAILGGHRPVVVHTTAGARHLPIWHRVRIEEKTREAATSLCDRLRAAGGPCLVQRN
jgi:hypothetical protein